MSWTTKEDRDALKELFTSGQIDKIEWTYHAGGDSLNDYEHKYLLNGEEVTPLNPIEPTDYILDNVDIADASDGHYLGEFGTVHITLEDAELTVSKDYQTEWSESYSEELSLEVSPEASKVFENIETLQYELANSSLDDLDFKKDLFINNKIATIIENTVEEMVSVADEFTEQLSGEIEEYRTIHFKDCKDNILEFFLNYSIIETRHES